MPVNIMVTVGGCDSSVMTTNSTNVPGYNVDCAAIESSVPTRKWSLWSRIVIAILSGRAVSLRIVCPESGATHKQYGQFSIIVFVIL